MKISFDAIINLIIMLIIIWSFISKLRKKQTSEPDDKSAKPHGFREIVGELINDLSEMDPGKREPIAKHTGWDHIISEKTLPEEIDDEFVDEPPPLPSAKKRTSADEKRISAPETEKCINHNQAFTLKQAVIWSEILAPPVSLRD